MITSPPPELWGHRSPFAVTDKDLDRLAYNEYLSFTTANGSPSDIYQLMVTMDRRFMAGLAYFLGIRKLGAAAIRVGPGNPELQIDSFKRFKPTALVTVPSFLLKVDRICGFKWHFTERYHH